MSRLTRALIVGSMLAAMHLAGMTAVAQAHATEQATRGDRQVPAQEQSIGDATVRRLLARERFSIPSGAPAQAASPMRPSGHSRAGGLAPALGVLAVVLAAGVAVLAARRASRTRRAGQLA